MSSYFLDQDFCQARSCIKEAFHHEFTYYYLEALILQIKWQTQGIFASPSHRPVMGRHNLSHYKALMGLDYNMAQAWIADRATSVHEGCSKYEPKEGHSESVTHGFISDWAITAVGFDAEAADKFLPHPKHSVAFLVPKHFSRSLKTPVLGLPMASSQGLRYHGCSLGKLPVLAA